MSERRFAFTMAFGLSLVATSSVLAQVTRIDGCGLRTIIVPLAGPNGRTDSPPPACGALPIVEDAWTMDPSCQGQTGDLLESETYQFTQFGPQQTNVVFVTKIKLPIPSERFFPYTVVEDIVIVPCVARSAQAPNGEDFSPGSPPQLVLIDDVTFGPIGGGADFAPATEFLCAVVVPLQDFGIAFGVSGCLDWFAVLDFDSTGNFYGQAPTPDLDGNGCPDAAIEPSVPGRFVSHTGLGEVGAGLVDFLLNRQALGLTRVDVHEASPSSPIPANLAGMKPGESRDSRPWCFSFAIGL